MSTYAQISDYQSYTSLTINTQSGGLQNLLDMAERDVDRILPKTVDLTDLIEGISMSNVTGGFFIASLPFGITTYTSVEIPFNVTGDELCVYLNEMADPYGNYISAGGSAWFCDDDEDESNPSGSWIQPEATFNDQYYAFGPLPGTPIVVEATGNIGSARLSLLTIDTDGLTGPVDTTPSVTVAQLVGGGLKVDPNQLQYSDQLALNRATCAQAEYRDQMGEAFFALPQFKVVSGPEFNTQGRRPLIGPKVFSELASTDLVQRGARAAASTRANRQYAYQPIGDLGIPDNWRAV